MNGVTFPAPTADWGRPHKFCLFGPHRARLIGMHSQPGECDCGPCEESDEQGRCTHCGQAPSRVWEDAQMRPVHGQRARRLRRRGEEVIDTGFRTPSGKHVFAWFVLRLPICGELT